MPSLLAASITVLPSGTSTGLPSISMFDHACAIVACASDVSQRRSGTRQRLCSM